MNIVKQWTVFIKFVEIDKGDVASYNKYVNLRLDGKHREAIEYYNQSRVIRS